MWNGHAGTHETGAWRIRETGKYQAQLSGAGVHKHVAQGRRQETEPGERGTKAVTCEQVTRGAAENYATLGYRRQKRNGAVQPKKRAVACGWVMRGHMKRGYNETGKQGRIVTAKRGHREPVGKRDHLEAAAW